MAKFIDASEGISRARTNPSWRQGFRSIKYFPDDIETMQQMAEETCRSAGGAAGWAITGGVLTVGLGLRRPRPQTA